MMPVGAKRIKPLLLQTYLNLVSTLKQIYSTDQMFRTHLLIQMDGMVS